MRATVRQYNRAADYERVGQFLVRTYRTAGEHINWVQPRWEYMHYHPNIRRVDLSSIGIWEAGGQIVGVVHPELSMGQAYFQIDPEYNVLKRQMLSWAEVHIASVKDGIKALKIYINDRDEEFQRIAREMGYENSGKSEPMSHLAIANPFPAIPLRDGFRLKSLAEDNDLRKLNRAIFRGFDHGQEPPDDGTEERKFMQSAPNYEKDLNIVVEAPDGNFVSYCGIWYEPVNKIAYVEPVCTDPDYRRMGLGRAAVLEGIRRCGERGARVACVTTTMPFYLSFGFRQVYNSSIWKRQWKQRPEAKRG